MVGGGKKNVEGSSSSCISSELAAAEKSPSQHDKMVKAQEKCPSRLCKENKGEEDEPNKGKEEEIDGEGNKGDSGEEEDEGGVQEEVEGEAQGMQMLEEGFYGVEAIRKKRNHNGQLQYLIKWRNYPETDNTWEPYDNIKHCTNLLEALELRLQKQKRKGKSALSKKKSTIQSEDGGDGPMTQTGGEDNSPLSPSFSRDSENRRSSGRALTIQKDIPVLRRNPTRNANSIYKKEKNMLKDENGKDEATTNEVPVPLPKVKQGVEEMNKEGGTNFVMQDYVRKWKEKEEAKVGVGAAAMAIFLPNCKADIAMQGEVPPENPLCYLYSESEPQGTKEGNRLAGARRRKAGRVRRFVHPDELAKKVMNVELVDSTEATTASAVAANYTAIGSDSKTDQEEFHITEILEPVQLSGTSSPAAGNISHVCITFKALRSDGTQVLVNNRELRAINPLLLIDFYEKHLRFP